MKGPKVENNLSRDRGEPPLSPHTKKGLKHWLGYSCNPNPFEFHYPDPDPEPFRIVPNYFKQL